MKSIITPKPRYDGPVAKAAEAIKKSRADKSKLISLLEEMEQIGGQHAEVERLEETLPKELDALLKSGKMDDQTVEKLARKRAFFDLLPARSEKLSERENQIIPGEFDAVSAPLKEAVIAADDSSSR
jgi:hypothetical protein